MTADFKAKILKKVKVDDVNQVCISEIKLGKRWSHLV